MAFEMETSSTANAAKLAVLWRDRGNGGGLSDGELNRLAGDLLRGATIQLTTIGPDGEPVLLGADTVFRGPAKLSFFQSTFGGVGPSEGTALVNELYAAAMVGRLSSLAALVADLRLAIDDTLWSRPSPLTTPVKAGATDVIPHSIASTLRAMKNEIEILKNRIATLEARL